MKVAFCLSPVLATPIPSPLLRTNWNTVQTVSVVGGCRRAETSTITIGHSVSSAADAEYDAATAPDVAVSVLAAPSNVQIQLGVTTSGQQLNVPEGGTNTYSMVLSHQPGGNVTVTVSNPTDNSDVTATPRSLTFTTGNWDTAQEVTVAAAQDSDAVNDSATVTHGINGGGYDGVTVPDVAVTVTDDETFSIVLSKSSLTVEEGDAAGVTYTVKLAAQPSEEVTVTVSGQAGTDLTLSGLSTANTLTFTTTNWNTAQTVTVKAGQDSDGADDSVTLTHTAAEGEYAGVSADLTITVTDDETAGLVLSESSITVDERDTTGVTYTVELATLPSETVTVTVSSHSGTDLTLSGLSTANTLTFTTENWNTAQTITVTASHDDDGADDSVTISHTAAGGEYAGVSADLPVTVTDDDRGIVLGKSSLEVDEGDADGSDLHRQTRHRAQRRGHRDGHRPYRHRPHPDRPQRGGHPDLHDHQLEHRSDHNGQGWAGRRME